MKTPPLPACTEGVTDTTLSAYRDAVLRPAPAAKLAVHIAQCPACRERLTDFDRLAADLLSERTPEPDERLWMEVRAAVERDAASAPNSGGRHPRPRQAKRSPFGTEPVWRGLGAVAAVLLIALAFAQLFASRGATTHITSTPTVTSLPTPTVTPTITPATTTTPALLPPHPLTWHAMTLPASATHPTIAMAGDGATAYACATTPASSPLVWATTDRGAHWTPAQMLPNPPEHVYGCELVVDQSDPSAAALCWLPNGGGAGDACIIWMTSVDRGLTWQQVPNQPFTAFNQLDSRGGVIYALRETVSASNSVITHLWASGNRMQSWRQVDHGLPSAVVAFWLQPGGSSILAVTSDGSTPSSSQLWSSPDDGATWKSISTPVALPSVMPARFADGEPQPNAIVAAARPGAPMQICIATNNPGVSNALTCSRDGGQHWQERPALVSLIIGMANDGAVLAEGAVPSVSAPITGYTLYRLAAGADRWQPLGPLPELGVAYLSGSAAGTLWAFPVPDIELDAQRRIFTAAYTP